MAVAVAVAIAAGFALVALDAGHTADTAACALYHGTMAGNDPNVTADLWLCENVTSGDARGVLRWRSQTSGSHRRYLVGTRRDDGLTMTDDRITDVVLKPGWIFCLVDEYRLERRGDRIQGNYVSLACRDEGTIDLTRDAAVKTTPRWAR